MYIFHFLYYYFFNIVFQIKIKDSIKIRKVMTSQNPMEKKVPTWVCLILTLLNYFNRL